MTLDERHTVLFAHPSADLYGADRMLVDSVRAVAATGARAVVALPADGPLRAELEQAGADVRVLRTPVLRKHYLRPDRAVGLVLWMLASVGQLAGTIRRLRPDVIYVNTITIPSWLAAARVARRPCLVHVHEAEEAGRAVGLTLTSPLLLARTIVVNSEASAATLVRSVPALRRRVELVYNGVVPPGEPEPLGPDRPGTPARLVLVGRLSPRKGSDVAVQAVAELRRAGRDVTLDLVGDTFAGYEWFEEELRARAAAPELAGRVRFHGFQADIGPFLRAADVVLMPSRAEPFGNAAVEALLAVRPLVASATQGLLEIVRPEQTGLLVPPDYPGALATAVARLLDDWPLALRLADAGRADAADRFSVERYQSRIVRIIGGLARRRP